MNGRNPVADHRIGEHVGAIAQRRDDEFVGRREFSAERCAEAPAQSAGGPEREKRAGLFARAMVGTQRIFVDDDRVLADSFADRMREIFRRDRRAGRGILRELRAPRAHAFGQSGAPRRDARVGHLQARFDRARERIERLRRARLNRKVARETAHRIANVERVFADVCDTAAARRMLQMRNPRHVGLDHDHQVGVSQERAGLEAEMHRMTRRQAHRTCAMRNDRDGAAFGQALESRHSVGVQGGGDDQRPLGGGDPFGERRDRARIGMGRRRLRARLYRRDRFGEGSGERLARQHEIDGPTRMRHRDFDAA